MASDQLFLSSGPLLKFLFNPIAFSLLCPIAFSACSSFKSMLPLLRPLASFPKSMPPLLRRFASSPEPTPPILHPIVSSPKPPLLRLAAPSLIAFYAYRSFNSVAAFSAYRGFINSMPSLIRLVKAPSRPKPPLCLADRFNRYAELVQIVDKKNYLVFLVSLPDCCIEDVKI